jgi:hypothetical protein
VAVEREIVGFLENSVPVDFLKLSSSFSKQTSNYCYEKFSRKTCREQIKVKMRKSTSFVRPSNQNKSSHEMVEIDLDFEEEQ